jgi:hypothetical protein
LLNLKFSGVIWYWRGPSPFHFVSIPEAESAKIKAISGGASYGWGAIPVVAKIGKSEFTTSIFPKDGLYIVPLKNAVRIPEGLELDQKITIELQIK